MFVMRKLSLVLGAALLLSLGTLGACNKITSDTPVLSASKMTRANYDQIHDKMTKADVRTILGAPTTENTEDKVVYKKTTYRYQEGDKYITITFKNDELDSKDTNLGT